MKNKLTLNDPNPFNHGQSSIAYKEISLKKNKKIINILDKGWGIKKIISLSISEISTGFYSSIYRVITDKQKYILKKSKINNFNRQEIISGCINHLYRASFPVPKLIKTISGKYHFTHTEKPYFLMKYTSGEHFNGSRKELFNAGKLLAHLHLLLEKYPRHSQIKALKKDVYPLDLESLDTIRQVINNNINITLDKDASVAVNTFLKLNFKKHINEMRSIKLPEQLGHFDFNPHNLIFNSKTQEIVALLDFDLIRISQRARDVSLGMHKLARIYGDKTEKKNDSGSSILSRAQVFLNGYNEISQLTQDEVSAISLLIIDEAIRKIIYLLKKIYLEHDLIVIPELSKQMTQINEAVKFQTLK